MARTRLGCSGAQCGCVHSDSRSSASVNQSLLVLAPELSIVPSVYYVQNNNKSVHKIQIESTKARKLDRKEEHS